MNMTTREIARFGQLYLQQGKWGGECVLSPSWVALATTRHTWSGWGNIGVKALGEGSDWEQGYGFQFWRCHHGAYRADGAAGQFTVILPERDMVVSINAGLRDMQKELSLIWDYLLPGTKDAPLAEGEALACLRQRIDALAIPPVAGTDKGLDAFLGHHMRFKQNSRGIGSFQLFNHTADGIMCQLELPAGRQRLPVGIGEWKQGEIGFDVESYEGLGMYIGRQRTAASCAVDEKGVFHLHIFFTNTPGHINLEIAPDGKVTGDFFAMNGCKLESK